MNSERKAIFSSVNKTETLLVEVAEFTHKLALQKQKAIILDAFFMMDNERNGILELVRRRPFWECRYALFGEIPHYIPKVIQDAT